MRTALQFRHQKPEAHLFRARPSGESVKPAQLGCLQICCLTKSCRRRAFWTQEYHLGDFSRPGTPSSGMPYHHHISMVKLPLSSRVLVVVAAE